MTDPFYYQAQRNWRLLELHLFNEALTAWDEAEEEKDEAAAQVFYDGALFRLGEEPEDFLNDLLWTHAYERVEALNRAMSCAKDKVRVELKTMYESSLRLVNEEEQHEKLKEVQ
jgi:hypothetical protein